MRGHQVWWPRGGEEEEGGELEGRKDLWLQFIRMGDLGNEKENWEVLFILEFWVCGKVGELRYFGEYLSMLGS